VPDQDHKNSAFSLRQLKPRVPFDPSFPFGPAGSVLTDDFSPEGSSLNREARRRIKKAESRIARNSGSGRDDISKLANTPVTLKEILHAHSTVMEYVKLENLEEFSMRKYSFMNPFFENLSKNDIYSVAYSLEPLLTLCLNEYHNNKEPLLRGLGATLNFVLNVCNHKYYDYVRKEVDPTIKMMLSLLASVDKNLEIQELSEYISFMNCLRGFKPSKEEYSNLVQRVQDRLSLAKKPIPENFYLDLSEVHPLMSRIEVKITGSAVLTRSYELKKFIPTPCYISIHTFGLSSTFTREFDQKTKDIKFYLNVPNSVLDKGITDLSYPATWINFEEDPYTLDDSVANVLSMFHSSFSTDSRDIIGYLVFLAIDDLLDEEITVARNTSKSISKKINNSQTVTFKRVIHAPRKRYVREYRGKTLRVKSSLPAKRHARRHTVSACKVRGVAMTDKLFSYWKELEAKGVYPVDNLGNRIPLPEDRSYTIRSGHERGGDKGEKESQYNLLPEVISHQVKCVLGRFKNCLICGSIGKELIHKRCKDCHKAYKEHKSGI